MDFYSVSQKIKQDEFDEDIYTEDDDEALFESELKLAIQDECGFNIQQATEIYNESYQNSHASGYESIVNHAKELSYFVRNVINMG
jgi:hypothetical protein